MESKKRLFSYNEALVALYLFFHDSYTLPSLGAYLPAIEDLPFIDYLARVNGNEEDLKAPEKSPEEQMSPADIRQQILKCADRRGVGFLL